MISGLRSAGSVGGICGAGAPQRGGLPARVSTIGAEARPRILRGNGRMQDMAGGLVQSAKNVNKR